MDKEKILIPWEAGKVRSGLQLSVRLYKAIDKEPEHDFSMAILGEDEGPALKYMVNPVSSGTSEAAMATKD